MPSARSQQVSDLHPRLFGEYSTACMSRTSQGHAMKRPKSLALEALAFEIKSRSNCKLIDGRSSRGEPDFRGPGFLASPTLTPR